MPTNESRDSNYELSADRPLTDPANDRLGYGAFAQGLSGSINSRLPTDGLVVAIYGPWGSGKSTAVNFILHHLRSLPEAERPVVVEFNPWWFSGQEDLTRRFFGQLRASLGDKGSAGKIVEAIGQFADVVSSLPDSVQLLAEVLPYVGTIKKGAELLKPKPQDVVSLKNSVAEALRKFDRRIVIVMDDIDRLTAEEIRQVFRLIKSVGDFPNVTYLLAFDKQVAISALENIQIPSGEAYLEKIVQLPFDLPPPDPTALRVLLMEKLEPILTQTPAIVYDEVNWWNVYVEGIDPFIKTPRDVARLSNTTNASYAVSKDEVHPVDFIALETLRVFCPTAYYAIRDNPTMFTGNSYGRRDHLEPLKQFHNGWLSEVDEGDQDAVRRLLLRVFPKLQAVWGNTFYGPERETEWRRQRRACSQDRIDAYFRLAPPTGGVSDAEMLAVIEATGDSSAFRERLLELAQQRRPAGSSRLSLILERLCDYTEDVIPRENTRTVVTTLYDVGDQLLLPEDRLPGVLSFGNDLRIQWVTTGLLRRLDEEERFSVLKESVERGRSIATIIKAVAWLTPRDGVSEALVSEAHFKELQRTTCQQIKNAADGGRLLEAPNLRLNLQSWKEWSGTDEAKSWVESVLATDEGLVALLKALVEGTYTHNLTDVVARRRHRLDPEWLSPYTEVEALVSRARALLDEGRLDEQGKQAVAQLLKEHQLRSQGQNPDWVA